ncbi:hypothetical protein ACE1TI_09495 [Alteribacillus sp. JSM 102045]|uniref:hypothetical protein n=1 Tax=Alteribacillus sp. JSM 102045 TaxID=1562101 RepID=UPI0035C00C4E
MSKNNIQAYFFSENDAESVKIKLQKLKADHVLADTIPEDTDFSVLVPLNTTGTTGGAAGIVPEPLKIQNDDDEKGAHLREAANHKVSQLNHILQFEIDEN